MISLSLRACTAFALVAYALIGSAAAAPVYVQETCTNTAGPLPDHTCTVPLPPTRGVDCNANTPCTTPATCVGTCPQTNAFACTVLTPRDLGPRFSCTSIETFNDVAGELKQAEVTITITPEVAFYRVENLGLTSANVLAQNPNYLVTGFIDVIDPTLPPGALPWAQTSNKVAGNPGSSGCLRWSVSDNLLVAIPTTPTLPPWDQCYDFNDPQQPLLLNPSGAPNICSSTNGLHGGPCIDYLLADGAPIGQNCCLSFDSIVGDRKRFGRIVPGGSISNCPLAAPPALQSGLTDRRDFNSGDAYRTTICITNPAQLNFFKRSFSGTLQPGFPLTAGQTIRTIPLSTQALQIFPSWNSSNIDQGGRIRIGVRVDVKYVYCPLPPVCQPDAEDVCRATDSMALINVLANDTASFGGMNCAALTGTLNLTQPTYGTVEWVNDPACVNSLCNLRCIKYTRNGLTPPPGQVLDTFSYTIVGNNGCMSTCTVTMRICSPECMADTGRVCDAPNAMTFVNVLLNDSNPCTTQTFNCARLTGAAGLTQGTYGSIVWADDPLGANPLCNLRGIKYTRNATPLPAGVTTDTVMYTISTLDNCTSTCQVTITICAPKANPDTGRVCNTLGSNTLVNVLNNDTANCGPVNCAALTGTTCLTAPTYGTVTWVDGQAGMTNGLCNLKGIRYTRNAVALPAGVFTDNFNYCFTDANGCTANGTVTITICAPTALGDTGTVCDVLNSTTLINVLGNDTANCPPVNCAALTGSAGITAPIYGTAVWVDSQATMTNALCNLKGIRYTRNAVPLPGGVFTEMFSYTFTDSNGCPATGNVTITICSPRCTADTGNACRVIGSTGLVNVFLNDSANCTVNCGALTGTFCTGTYGTFAWANNAAFTNSICNLKGVVYTLTSIPPTNPATDTCNYTFTDSNGCVATCSITITIASPQCVNDTGDVCRSVGQFQDINVLANDTSPRPLNCALLTGNASATPATPCVGNGLTNGTYGTTQWLAGSCANGLCTGRCVRYTLNTLPPAGTNTDTFTYCITDTNGCTSTCTVTVTISTPVCLPDCADACATVGSTATVDVLANDTSRRPLNCGLLTGVASGANGLTNGTYGSAEWVSCSSTNSLCPGKCVKYTVTSVPPAGVTQDTFTYKITDTFGCMSTCTVTVKFCRIDAVNDAPVMSCAPHPVRLCVLDNDTSSCGALSCANLTIATQPANGIVQIVQNCAGLPSDCCNTALPGCTGCCLVYTPNPGFSGTDTFTYRISTTSSPCGFATPVTCTDTATASVIIKPAPTAQDDTYSLDMGGVAGPFDVRANDSPGTGCAAAGCPAVPAGCVDCCFKGCPQILTPPLHGTLTMDPVTCQFTYTAFPGVPFPGSDTFTYCVRNNCDCCDEARVTISNCPMINRQQPGSLLIYPEFDNRPGRTTYITITNSSCKWPNSGVWVEFIYINKETCIETNRTTFLTPCDTYTVVTSAHNPNPVRGYMYAFAKDSLNRPISFNHLIGDLLILDGLDGFQYAVNPVSFRSPLPQGAFTDLDNDGIQDLNDLEYEGAPEMLLIPRFLGQDPPGQGVFQDELVVLGLSGGLSFQTVLSFIGYNDNEVPFSVTKQFYCWEKWKLTDISGAFDNQYLKNLGHDPLEIIGMPARESGWLKIDGASAFSEAETIIDPAFYAFLVERMTTEDRAAELPFEVCTQGNGDLLPKNPFGDGPNPVAGDNQ